LKCNADTSLRGRAIRLAVPASVIPMGSGSVMVTAGNFGPDVRSDCRVSLDIQDSGGLDIIIRSKVGTMYGESIRGLVCEVLSLFDIEHAHVELDDSGALPFTLAARLETAVRRARSEETREFLPGMLPANKAASPRQRFRRSRLYLPGNSPKFMINAGLHKPDGIILDLEDSVAPSEKDAARILVRNALCQVDFCGSERMVRINQVPLGLEDLKYIVPHNVHLILIPKCENPEQVRAVDAEIARIFRECGRSEPVYLMPILESAAGILSAREIAAASPNNVALTIGLEDYTADIGVERTPEGRESFFARCMIVNAARAAGLQPIDTVFSDVADDAGLMASILEAKSLGFEGKGCIHPRQIRTVHKGFAPSPSELEKAGRIVAAYEDAQARGSSVTVVGSKMIDPPVVKRALRVIHLAQADKQ